MAELMLLNPLNPRKRRKAKAKSSPKRRAVARRSTKKRRYARNPIGANPVRKRRSTTARKYRRNPIGGRRGGKLGGMLAPLKPAAISAVGAIGLDLAWGVIGDKLPAGMGTGPIRHVAKAAGALLLGTLASMVTSKATGSQLSVGALTVVFHGAMKDAISTNFPGVQLGEDVSNYGMNGLAEYFPMEGMEGMGEYESYGMAGGMGEYFGTDSGVAGVGYSGGGEYFDGGDLMGMGETEDEMDVFSTL